MHHQLTLCIPVLHLHLLGLIRCIMCLQEFLVLEKEEQVNVIKQCGTFLFIRQEAGIDVVLYQIAGFYVEVFFEGNNKKNIRIKGFDDTATLDLYLKEISLSELEHLF